MKIYGEKVEELYPIEKLNSEDKNNLFCSSIYIKDFVKRNNMIYHVRKNSLIEIIDEILGELISDYFELKAVRSELYKDDGTYFLLTELFTNVTKKYSYIDKLFPENIVYGNLCELENISIYKDLEYDKCYDIDKNCLKKLLVDLKKLVVVDYITGQNDRHSENFMFCYNKEFIKLMPVYDFGSLFNVFSNCNTLLGFNLDLENIVEFIRNDDTFQELLEKVMNFKIKDIFRRLENEYPIKLSMSEKWDYESFINSKKYEIKKYKLIR